MARTKQDFLSYARQNLQSNSQSRLGDRSQIYSPDIDGGNETSRDDVWRTDSNDGYTDENAAGYQPEGSSESIGDVGSGETETGTTYTDDGRMDSSSTSSTGIIESTGSYDVPVRNIDRSSYKSVGPISGSTTKSVTKKRSSLVDKAAGFLGVGNLSTRKPKQQIKPISTTARKLLTIAEVSKNRPVLIRMIMLTSDHMDDGISAITKGHRPVTIWGNLEYTDAEILADALQEAGQRSEWVADKVRVIMKYHSKLQAGIILVPRTWKSIMYMVTTGLDIRIM